MLDIKKELKYIIISNRNDKFHSLELKTEQFERQLESQKIRQIIWKD